MDKITFREAQLMVIGATGMEETDKVLMLNNLQTFFIDDSECLKIVGIDLQTPHILVKHCSGTEHFCNINMFSDKVVDTIIDIMRSSAFNIDFDNN